MKITLVLGHELPFPSQKGGGVNSLLGQLVDNFVKLGHEVTVFSPKYKELLDYEVKHGVRHIRVKGANRKKNLGLNFFCGIPYFFRVLLRIEYSDILSCHMWHGFLFSFFNVSKIKIHTVHRDPKKLLVLFKFFDRIYFASDSVCDEAKKILPSMKNKFKTVYNCVDYNNYTFSKPIIKNEIKFLYVGRYSNDKGLMSLFEGMKKAITFDTNIKLKTIGPLNAEGGSETNLIEQLKTFITNYNLEEHIEISGPIYDRKELDNEVSNHHVVVLPSIFGETLNMVVLECMRIGRAQLISDLPANLPLNVEGVTGYFCSVGNSDAWFQSILKITKEIRSGKDFGINSFEYGKQKFSSEVVSYEYINDFMGLINKT